MKTDAQRHAERWLDWNWPTDDWRRMVPSLAAAFEQRMERAPRDVVHDVAQVQHDEGAPIPDDFRMRLNHKDVDLPSGWRTGGYAPGNETPNSRPLPNAGKAAEIASIVRGIGGCGATNATHTCLLNSNHEGPHGFEDTSSGDKGEET